MPSILAIGVLFVIEEGGLPGGAIMQQN